MRRFGGTLLLAALLLAAAAGLTRATQHRPADLAHRTAAVSATLRCPTCAGESVAASRSDSAAAMRAEISDQLRAGHSPADVRAWFAQRYGEWVLLDPPARGSALPLWVLPPALALAGALVVGIAVLRGRQHHELASPAEAARPHRSGLVTLGSLVAAAGLLLMTGVLQPQTKAPEAVAARTTSTAADRALQQGEAREHAGQLSAAAAVYTEALRRNPREPRLTLRLGFALLRLGQATRAQQVLAPLAAADPDQPQVVLLLGLTQRQLRQPQATGTLNRFLRLAPDDPAAALVRNLLAHP